MSYGYKLQGGYGVSCYQLGYMQSQHIHRSLSEVGCGCEIADSFSGLHILTDNGCESGFLLDASIDKVISIAWLGSIDRLHQSSDDLLGYVLILMDSSCVWNLDSWCGVCPYIVEGGKT